MSSFFQNKTALITGASRGIGAAIAQALAHQGCNLVLTCSHSLSELQRFSANLEAKYSIKCTPLKADAGSYEEIADLFSQLERKQILSSIDILINNAGISHVGLLQDMSPAQWQRVISVNLDSAFYTCKHIIPIFLRNGSGRILNISSVWGNCGASMEVAYSASKGGLNAFTKALARELAPNHIPVNAIACGMIDTQMNACFSPEDLEAIREEIPADRLGSANEVAELALSLLQSPDYMTGQIVTMDGGWT